MSAGFHASGDMERVAARRADGCGEAPGISTRIDASAHAVRRADASEDIEARVGGISDETERFDIMGKSCDISSRDAGQQERAPGRGAQAAVAVALGEFGEACQRIGVDAAEGQANAEGAALLISQ